MYREEYEKELNNLQKQLEETQNKISELKRVNVEELETKERWKPKHNQIYWYIAASGDLYFDRWKDNEIDEWKYLTNNVFKTAKEVLERKKKIEIQSRFKNYVEERTEELDWNNGGKYYLFYNYANKEIVIDNSLIYKRQGTIYASSEQILKDAIEEIGEENVKKYILEVEDKKDVYER